MRLKSDNSYLICSYSALKYHKDKFEMEKQKEKANQLIKKLRRVKKTKISIRKYID
jgi:hypothetical protein